MKQPGITAIAHPASLKVATTHGVFVLQEMEEIVQRYRKSKLQFITMGANMLCFFVVVFVALS